MNKLIIAMTLVLSANAAAEDSLDSFKDIRQVWNTCAACHGPQGQGGLGPKLQGQNADYIISKLLAYKAGQVVGPQSAMMWPTAKGLTDGQIGTIGVYIQQGMPNE